MQTVVTEAVQAAPSVQTAGRRKVIEVALECDKFLQKGGVKRCVYSCIFNVVFMIKKIDHEVIVFKEWHLKLNNFIQSRGFFLFFYFKQFFYNLQSTQKNYVRKLSLIQRTSQQCALLILVHARVQRGNFADDGILSASHKKTHQTILPTPYNYIALQIGAMHVRIMARKHSTKIRTAPLYGGYIQISHCPLLHVARPNLLFKIALHSTTTTST